MRRPIDGAMRRSVRARRTGVACLGCLLVGCGGGSGAGVEGDEGVVGGAGPGTGTGSGAAGAGSAGAGGAGAAVGGTGAAGARGGDSDAGAGGQGQARGPDGSGVPMANDAAAARAADAQGAPTGAPPALMSGVWKNISPADVPFGVVPNTFTQGLAIDSSNPAVLYVGVNGFDPKASKGGVYKTTDAGSTWRRIGTPNLDEPVRVRVDPRNPRHLYVGDGVRGGTMGFWVSIDGGETWTKPKSWSAVPASIGIKSGSGMDDVYDIAVDPGDFNHLLVTFHSPWNWNEYSKGSGVLESKDGGETWIVHPPFPGSGFGNNIWFLGNSTTWLLGTQGKGFWRTADAGANWTQVATNNMQHGGGSLYRSKSGVLYAAGIRIMRSVDEGVSWSLLAPSAGYNAVIGDGARLYTRGGFGSAPMLNAPEESGTPWTEYSPQKFGAAPFEMVFDTANDIIYSASWGDGVYALKIKR